MGDRVGRERGVGEGRKDGWMNGWMVSCACICHSKGSCKNSTGVFFCF